MKLSKNHVTIGLILSSIALLLVLQVFWIRSVYWDELHSLEREAHMLFRNTVFEMTDSLMQQDIESLSPDSAAVLRRISGDTLRMRTESRGYTQGIWRDSSKNVQIFVYSGGSTDTVKRYLRPLLSRIRKNEKPQTFSIRLRGDSLNTSDIEKEFKQSLGKAGIDLPAHVLSVGPAPVFLPRSPDFKPEQAIFTPMGGFRAELGNLTWIILKKIAPQILFATFLTLLTTASFIILYRSLRAQQRLMELKNDFISNITHELKTPVTTVGVAIEALKNFNGLGNPKLAEEYLNIAQHELNRLTILTDNVLKTASFEEKGVDVHAEKVDFANLVDQVVTSMKLIFEKQNADVRVEKTGANFFLTGSEVHLTNVVYNLLDNALKYSTASPKITIRLSDKENAIALSVEDNGMGIATEFRKKVFEKFFRVPTGDVHNTKGYGLGLSYVDSVIKSHKGTIELDSELGKGSHFTITLPKFANLS